MKTPITEMFGIDVPILAFSHCRDVIAAVCKAGGMGVLGAAAHSEEALEIDLAWIENEIGDRPYGVDLIVPQKYAGSDEGGLTREAVRGMIPPDHRQFVDGILERYDVPPLPAGDGGPDRADGARSAGTSRGEIFSSDRADRSVGDRPRPPHGARSSTPSARPPPTCWSDRRPRAARSAPWPAHPSTPSVTSTPGSM